MSTLRYICHSFVFSEDVAGLRIWSNVLSNQFGNLTFFWLKVDKWQSLRFLYIAIFIFEYMSLWKWILLYFLSWFWFIPLRLRKKSLDRKTKVKQKCCKVSIIGKKLFCTISKTSGSLLRRSAKRHLANNYIKLVALGGFGKFSISKNKNKNYAGLGGCLLRWITSAFISIILHILLSFIP